MVQLENTGTETGTSLPRAELNLSISLSLKLLVIYSASICCLFLFSSINRYFNYPLFSWLLTYLYIINAITSKVLFFSSCNLKIEQPIIYHVNFQLLLLA